MHAEQMDFCSGQTLALCLGNACFENGHIIGYQDLGFRGFFSPPIICRQSTASVQCCSSTFYQFLVH